MANSCNHVQNLIPSYLKRQLEALDREYVEEHVARCAECRSELEESDSLAGILGESLDRPEPPEGFAEGVSALIEQET